MTSIENKQRLTLVAIMILVALSVTGISMYSFHTEHLKDHRDELIHIVESRARLIEAVARFDKQYSSNYPGGTREATISQIRDAQENFAGFDETGEFMLGQKNGEEIVFLLTPRHQQATLPIRIPMAGKQAEPMRRALRGAKGTIVAQDYRGVEVLAAYQYIKELDLGLVAKVDVSEIYEPFIQAGIFVGVGGLIFILIGTMVFFKVSGPLVQSIKDKEKQLDSVLTGAEVFFWDWKIKTDEVVHDPRWSGFLGYDEEEIKSTLQQCIDLVHPGDLPKVQRELDDHIQGISSFIDVEYRALKKSGEWTWILDRGKILERDNDGKPLRAYGTYQSIQERKDADQALQESEERLELALEGGAIRFWDWNIKTGQLIFDENWIKDLGYDKDEIKNTFEQWELLTHPDDLPGTRETINAHLKGKTHLYEAEYRVLHKSGHWLWTLDRGRIVEKNMDGKPIRFCGTFLDITERKKAEEALSESEKDLSHAQEIANLGNWVWEIPKNELRWSNQIFRIFGLNKQKFGATYEAFLERVHPEDRQMVDNAVNKAFVEGTPYNIEHRITLLDGSEKIVHELAEVEFDSSQKPIKMIGTVQDITERKRSEEKIAEAQKQLVASQKLAGIGELTAGVSHEVLNPVNIISVHTQMLQKKVTDNPYVQEFCKKTRHEIDRIQKIMGSLLEFSRRGNIELETGHMRDAIEKVLALIEKEFKLDNIEIVRDWCDTLVDISYDPDKIRQVYLNLLNNAKHSMPDGGTITVGCKAVKEREKKFHQFSFSDTGTGMNEETRLRLFEPFYTTKP